MTDWTPLAAVLAFSFTTLLTRRFCDPASSLHLLDLPNERSLHSQPTPRSGGVAILAGFALAFLLWIFAISIAGPILWLMAGAGIIAAVSFLDDSRGLSAGARFLGHLMGAGLVVIGAGLTLPPLFPGVSTLSPVWLGVSLSVVYLVWMVNLYNFMDGMDGFAAGMAVIGFGAFAVLGWLAGNAMFFGVSLIIASAVGGFLMFNFPPARIFMGDTGSATLGLMAGGLSLWGGREAVFPFWVSVLVFSPFIVDATVTLLWRLLRREPVWRAHKSHFYQRLVLLGWGHRKTVMAEYVLMLLCAGCAVWVVTRSSLIQSAMLVFWVFTYVLLAGLVRGLERRGTGEQQ